MVLGRREISAILLAAAAIVFYLVLLSTTPSGAQTGGSTTNGLTIDQYNDELDIEDNLTIEEDPVPQRTNRNRPIRPRRPRTQEIVNIPQKPLPPSGGIPVYGTVAGFVLTGAGLLALGLLIRRGTGR